MAGCAECARQTDVWLRGVRVRLSVWAAVLAALLFGTFGWLWDAADRMGPFSAHHTWPYLLAYYLLMSAFFGLWMYWLPQGFRHAAHAGWRRVLAPLVLKLAASYAGLFALGDLLRHSAM